jgi:hypothetical protein
MVPPRARTTAGVCANCRTGQMRDARFRRGRAVMHPQAMTESTAAANRQDISARFRSQA